MIKTTKFLALLTIIAFNMAVISCVQDDDFTVPDGIGMEENKGLEALLSSGAIEMSIIDLKTKLADKNNHAFQVDTNIYIKGYVSSSDRVGNFFKEIFLQDSPDNPTAGIKIIINQVDTYNQYNMGREVFIKLKDLYIGEERVGNGVATIGGAPETNQFGTAVKRLTERQRAQHMFRSSITTELVPLPLNFKQVNGSHIGIYVQFKDVEFADNLAGQRYFDATQDFDTLRAMQSCSVSIGYSNFVLETSLFAAFKDDLLPNGNGTISGVIAKTFDGSALVLAVNNITDIKMTESRCNPSSIEDFKIAFEENFESARANSTFNFEGWTNFAEAGNSKWKEKNMDGNGYVEFSSFGSRNPSNVGWLITPQFNLEAHAKKYLNFKAAQHHVISPNNKLEVMISTNYNGVDILTATWIPIEASLPSAHSPNYQYVDSGLIDLSLYIGTVHIAFKVTGSGTNETLAGTFQIDNFIIFAAK